jgi:hypothetical protein
MRFVDRSVVPGTTGWYTLTLEDWSGTRKQLAARVIDFVRLETRLRAPRHEPNGTWVFPYDLGAAADRVRIAIYDVRGQLVRRLEAGSQVAGRHEAVWDMATDNGGRVARGVYFARLMEPSAGRPRRFVITRVDRP